MGASSVRGGGGGTAFPQRGAGGHRSWPGGEGGGGRYRGSSFERPRGRARGIAAGAAAHLGAALDSAGPRARRPRACAGRAAPIRFAAFCCSGGGVATGDPLGPIASVAARSNCTGAAPPPGFKRASGEIGSSTQSSSPACPPCGAPASICCPLDASNARTAGLASAGVVSRRRGSHSSSCHPGTAAPSHSCSPSGASVDCPHGATAP